MKNYFIFPAEGRPIQFSDSFGGSVKVDMIGLGPATAVAYFDRDKLIADLKDLTQYLEKNGKRNKT